MPLQPLVVRDLPEPPRNLWRIVGPGIVAAGVGLSSGEFIIWPFIASQVGLIFLWAAVLGIVTQFFLNMEIERYTLATGETALTGFNRFWKHWGLVLAVMVYFANLWPGWVLSASTLASYIFGGNPRYIAICALLIIGAALTLAPVVYVALERMIFVKVAAVALVVAIGIVFAISADTWRALPAGLVGVGNVPLQLGFALLLGAVAFAGAGGGQNLCQSNWIRDKGFGMGQYVPKLVSAVTGEEQAAPTASAFIFEPTEANMARWRKWWIFANIEQIVTFVFVTVATICLTSMLAHSTLFGTPGLPQTVAFLQIEGPAAAGDCRLVVRRAVLGDRVVFALRLGDGHRRLYEPPGGGRPEVDLPAVVGRQRKPPVLLAGVGAHRARLLDPAHRHGPAAGAAGDFSIGRGHHDVPLFGAAAGSEPEGAAGGDQDSVVPRRGDGVVGRFFRDPRQPDHLAATQDLAAVAAKRP